MKAQKKETIMERTSNFAIHVLISLSVFAIAILYETFFFRLIVTFLEFIGSSLGLISLIIDISCLFFSIKKISNLFASSIGLGFFVLVSLKNYELSGGPLISNNPYAVSLGLSCLLFVSVLVGSFGAKLITEVQQNRFNRHLASSLKCVCINFYVVNMIVVIYSITYYLFGSFQYFMIIATPVLFLAAVFIRTSLDDGQQNRFMQLWHCLSSGSLSLVVIGFIYVGYSSGFHNMWFFNTLSGEFIGLEEKAFSLLNSQNKEQYMSAGANGLIGELLVNILGFCIHGSAISLIWSKVFDFSGEQLMIYIDSFLSYCEQ